MAELPGGVGGTPALVPADAAASVQAGDLAEIYNSDLKVTGGWKSIAAPCTGPASDHGEAGGAGTPIWMAWGAQHTLKCRDFPEVGSEEG